MMGQQRLRSGALPCTTWTTLATTGIDISASLAAAASVMRGG
jgi:hypothetical protein